MAKKQTRKSISVRRATYERLQAHAEATGESVSGLVEEWVAEAMIKRWTATVSNDVPPEAGDV